MAVYPYVISLREGLEAALIIAIIVGYLLEVKRPDLKRYVWWGVGSAIALSLGLGAGVWMLYGELAGLGAKLFEAGSAGTAVIVLTYMIFWMARNSKEIKGELERKIDVHLSEQFVLGIALLAFIAVFREGLETVLFLTASVFSNPTGTVLGAAGGFATVIVIGYLLFRMERRLPIQKFFTVTSVLLLVFAGGILSYGVHEGIEAAEVAGYEAEWLGAEAYNLAPSTSSMFHPEEGAAGSVIQGLVGKVYLAPEWLTLVSYLGYWLVVGSYVLKTYRPAEFGGFVDRVFGRGRQVKTVVF